MDYRLGINRIIYQAPQFQTGLAITATMRSPALVKSEGIELTEIESGLYFFDFDFTEEGPWIGMFYEGEDKVMSAVFRVGDTHVWGIQPRYAK